MGESLQNRGRPTGLLRFFLRLPIALYRVRLGFLLGRRFLMLEHVGRSSGLRRYVVIEVVDHDPQTGAYWVCSGWGRGADWFRNIQKTPEVWLTAGWRRSSARARELEGEEAAAPLRRYASAHPYALRKLAEMMLGEAPADAEQAVERLVKAVPVVELSPR